MAQGHYVSGDSVTFKPGDLVKYSSALKEYYWNLGIERDKLKTVYLVLKVNREHVVDPDDIEAWSNIETLGPAGEIVTFYSKDVEALGEK